MPFFVSSTDSFRQRSAGIASATNQSACRMPGLLTTERRQIKILAGILPAGKHLFDREALGKFHGNRFRDLALFL